MVPIHAPESNKVVVLSFEKLKDKINVKQQAS